MVIANRPTTGRGAAVSPALCLFLAMLALFLLPACRIHVDDEHEGKKKVDIRTPMGEMHIGEEAKASDTGLSVYPGARLRPDDDSPDKKRANINISSSGFGLRVVAVTYESADAPEKVIAYYAKELKRFGDVIQCSGSNTDFNVNLDDKHHLSDQVHCGDGKGEQVELKVGTQGNQHIVAVKPSGHGSEFALVFVRTRTGETI
jgi:hypothetical protein